MPEFGDVDASYYSVGETPFSASWLDSGPTFDPYASNIPASAGEVEDLTRWSQGLYSPSPSVTAQPTPIDYDSNIISTDDGFFDKFKDFFSGFGGAIADTPLFKAPGFIDETIKGIPDTPLLKLAGGVGDVADDAIGAVGGFGAIGSMLPLLIIMMLMKK